MNHRNALLACALCLALLPACKRDAASNGPADTATGMQAAIEQAAQDAGDAGALPGGDAPLKTGQSVQGFIEADLGKGTLRYRSLATRVADDIAEQMDEKLATGKSSKAIEDANRKLEALGTGMKVDAGDVRDIVGGMAGKTFHDSEVRHIDIIQSLQVTLKGNAGDGGQLELSLRFDDKALSLSDARLSYRPKATSMFDFYESKDVQATIERFAPNDDGTYAIAGTFEAKDVPASKLAKKLAGNTLASASGRFDFAALPLKEMPKTGR